MDEMCITPDSLISSVRINTKCAEIVIRVTVANSFWRVKRIAREKSAAITNPKAMPASTMMPKSSTPWKIVLPPWNPSVATASTTKKSATAVPSLNKLSPSKIMLSRFGALASLKSVSAAAGSVAEITAPNSNAKINGISKPISGKVSVSKPAITRVETSNPTTESNPIDQTLSSMLRIFILKPDSKINTGKKIKNKSSGVSTILPKKPIESCSHGMLVIGTSSSPTKVNNTV